eukprot:TRINITY_DN11658_c0_g1_i1.p1 TRINITY_DN11658_c0_g1~~TRINITY_DN11658_c0_g1_i1.p1  ORF type:complete len:547 (-),score=75.92 TRINITY_DN11658_c0_g1_i1:40-1611(-)
MSESSSTIVDTNNRQKDIPNNVKKAILPVVLTDLTAFFIAFIIPLTTYEINPSGYAITLVMTALPLGNTFGAVISGVMVDKTTYIDFWVPIMAMLKAVSYIGIYLMIYLETIVGLASMMFALGFGASSIVVAMQSFVADYVVIEHRAQGLGVLRMYQGFGISIGSFIGFSFLGVFTQFEFNVLFTLLGFPVFALLCLVGSALFYKRLRYNTKHYPIPQEMESKSAVLEGSSSSSLNGVDGESSIVPNEVTSSTSVDRADSVSLTISTIMEESSDDHGLNSCEGSSSWYYSSSGISGTSTISKVSSSLTTVSESSSSISSKSVVIVKRSLILLLILILAESLVGSVVRPFIVVYLKENVKPLWSHLGTNNTNIEVTDNELVLAYAPGGIISMILAPQLGKLADVVKIRYLLSLASVLGAVVTALLLLVKDVYWAIIVLIIDFCVLTIANLALTKLVTGISHEKKGRFLSLVEFAVNIGSVTGPIIGGILWENVDPTAPFWFSVGVEGVLALLYLCLFFVYPMDE